MRVGCSGQAGALGGWNINAGRRACEFEVALKRLGSDPARTVMIGDQTATDILAGQRAGLFSILVQTGVPETSPRHAEPDLTLDSLATLK